MSKSSALRPADVGQIVRVVGECRDLGDDAAGWRVHFAREAGRLVGAIAAITGEMRDLREGRPINIGAISVAVEAGFDLTPWQVAYREYAAGRLTERTTIEGCMTRAGQSGQEASAPDMVGKRDWYRSRSFKLFFQAAGVDANLFSFHPVPGGADEFSGIILSRAAGRPPFGPREIRLIHTLHTTVTGLVGGALARFNEPSPSQLAPRQREVLRCLLEGEGDKQVAARLGISRFTVNQHTKAIYRHFGVAGRAELLARWVRRGWGAGGRWDEGRTASPRPCAGPSGPGLSG